MKTDTFHVKGKEITLYHAANADSPLILFNHFSGEGEAVMAEARKLANRDFSLLCVGNVDWNHDMSPWHCPPIMPGDAEYTGGADAHLQLLVEEILPEGLRRLEGKPSHIGIAGYSLAGLFAGVDACLCGVISFLAQHVPDGAGQADRGICTADDTDHDRKRELLDTGNTEDKQSQYHEECGQRSEDTSGQCVRDTLIDDISERLRS